MGVLLIKDNQYGGAIDQRRPVWGVLLIKNDQYGGPIDQGQLVWGSY